MGETWTCEGCNLAVSWMEGVEAPAMPASWVVVGDNLYCLHCRRDRAGEAAVVELAEDAPPADRERARTQARIEFEIGRDPGRPDNRIAKACRTSTLAVRKARSRMGLPDRPPRLSDRTPARPRG